MRLPALGLGWGAADLLIRLLAADETIRAPNVILETELIVRAWCGARSNRL